MIVFPNAKINIGLQILNKRADGFHNICSIFYPVAWSDVLEVVESKTLQFASTGIEIQGNPKDNLCVKVYLALQKLYPIPPVAIHLHKNIPVGAGLGGGSSDAAFCLKLLNDKFKLGMNTSQMIEFIKPFGSDCAFFIDNKATLATQKGDMFDEVDINLAGKHILMVYPDLFISTKEAYQNVSPHEAEYDLRQIANTPISNWQNNVTNDFEKALTPIYPVLNEVKNQLKKLGAIYTAMSGSGSTMYGIFENELSNYKSVFPPQYKLWHGKL